MTLNLGLCHAAKAQNPPLEIESPYFVIDKGPPIAVVKIPYRERRPRWGRLINLSFSEFTPLSYEPNFFTLNWDEVYPEKASGFELGYVFKRNLGPLSLGIDSQLGFTEVSSEELETKLTMYILRSAVILRLDGLFKEPWLVPTAGAGLYGAVYSEELGANEKGGNTSVAPFFQAGAAIQLNWIEPNAANAAYAEQGLQNYFLNIDYVVQSASRVELDPDFSAQFLRFSLGAEF